MEKAIHASDLQDLKSVMGSEVLTNRRDYSVK